MGSSLDIDSKVSLVISFSKDIFVAGQFLQGIVHLDVLAPRKYKYLVLRIVGQESTSRGPKNNPQPRSYHIKTYPGLYHRETYRDELTLATFPHGLQIGQYDFPFEILLPSALPASMILDQCNYIKYTLAAYLPAFDENSSTQQFQRSVQIRQFNRLPQQIFKNKAIKTSVCCNCCCSKSSIGLTLQSNINLNHSSPFVVKGVIDNSNGIFPITKINIRLIQKIKKQTSENQYRTIKKKHPIVFIQAQILVGDIYPFEYELVFPSSASGHTAIGNIISRAYFLELCAGVSCCYSDAKVQGFVVYNNQLSFDKDQNLQVLNKLTRREPFVHPLISLFNLRPYIYNPAVGIKIRNQGNGQSRPIFHELEQSNNLTKQDINFSLAPQFKPEIQADIQDPIFYAHSKSNLNC